ncbi:MAG: beta-galactosidase trimerization domain-containing protein [Anaerolineae bacterium]
MMEQQSGCGGWQEVGVEPRPGEMRLWTYQAIAHGADAIIYFRWRTARYGTEQFWHGVLEHHGQPRRRYRELQQIGAELARAGAHFLGAESRAQVAMILSYDSRFAFQGQPNHSDFRYAELFRSYYAALYRRNVGVDIVPPAVDLDPYGLVIAPALYVLDDETAGNLRRYVEKGGTLLVTARSGVKDGSNATVSAPLPGLLADVCGVEVEEYDALHPGTYVPLVWERIGPGSGMPEAHASLWCDILAPSAAQTIARYQGEFYAGRAAITLNQCGQGRAAYVGTLAGADLHDAVIEWLMNLANVSPVLSTPNDVEALERWQGDQRLLFLLNHADTAREIALPQPMTDLLSGQASADQVILEPRGAMVLQAG